MYSSAVTILKVEPGGYCPWVTRFNNTELSSSSMMESQIAPISLGSKPGWDTMASIFPVATSVTTMAPL